MRGLTTIGCRYQWLRILTITFVHHSTMKDHMKMTMDEMKREWISCAIKIPCTYHFKVA